MVVKCRAYGDYDADKLSDETGFVTEGPSLAVQSQKDEADINVIVRNFGITGKLPENPRLPTYGDFTGINDFQSALNAVISAQASFMELPAEVRSAFDNDPQRLLEAVESGEREKLEKLGLLRSRVETPNSEQAERSEAS